MLDFADAPYCYYPPRYFGPTAWLLRQFNRYLRLPSTLKITSLTVENSQKVQAIHKQGDAIVLVPNHPTHADAAMAIEAFRRIGLLPRTMAAYDVFLRGKLDTWVMQRLGCFSVDREGSDKKAMDQALHTLTDTRFALTIFAEGNVYLTNDRVTPYNDGPAFIALRAAKKLRERADDSASKTDPDQQTQKLRRVWLVPVAMKATHVTDCKAHLTQLIHELAQTSGVELTKKTTPLQALKQIGTHLIERNVQHRNHQDDNPIALSDNSSNSTDLAQLTQQAASHIITQLENQLTQIRDSRFKAKPNTPLIERIRACRRQIHAIRTDPDRIADHRAAANWADQAITAFRIASYSGDYVSQSPTLDRISETVEKIYEDIHDRALSPFAQRHARVRFGEPINVTQAAEDSGKSRQIVANLTQQLENQAQSMLDTFLEQAQKSPTPGAQIWDEPLA